MSKIPIGVYVTPQQYKALTSIADRKSVQVHTLLEDLVTRALNPGPRKRGGSQPRVDHDKLLELHALGLNDRQIGDRLGFTSATIFEHRGRLGLPKNTRNGRPKRVAETAS